MNGKRCVIIGAAEISNYEFVKKNLSSKDYFIFCDGGLNHKTALAVEPDLIVGDFDSYSKEKLKNNTAETAKIIFLPREKDDTDTFYAVKEALKMGFTEFVLAGAVGQRFDHSLVNISILLYLKEQGAKAIIIDDYSKMELVGSEPVLINDDCSYFSLMCIDGNVSGVNITNSKWNLENAEIKTSYQYGCSNEVLPGKTAEVSVQNGVLLLLKIYNA